MFAIDYELSGLYNNPDTRKIAMEKAVEYMHGYIVHAIDSYNPQLNYHDRDDIFQECNIAVMSALKTYDISKNATFITWCRLYIKNAIIGSYYKNVYGMSLYKKEKYNIEIVDMEEYKDEYSNESDIDIFENIIRGEDINNRNQALYHALDNAILNPVQKYIIIHYYGIGCNPQKTKEISKSLGLTTDQIRHKRSYAIERLRKFYNQA